MITMGPTSMIPLFCSLLIASAGAFDILEILKSDTDDYTTFAKLLTDTKLADEINSRQTITVLALNNAAVGAITSLPTNLQKEVLSVHVILDYYDPVKLDTLKQKTVLLTTLFQSSGQATGQMGFLNYTELPNETQVFGSAVPGAQLDSNLIGVVAARPYNISVIEVSKAIIPPGLNGAGKAPPPTPSAQSPSTPPSNATSPTPPSNATSPAPKNAAKPPTGSTTPSSGNATAPSSGNATTPSPKSAPTPSGSTAAPAPKESANAPTNNDASPPTDSKATPPTQAASPSADEATPPTSGDQTTPTEAPSGSATEAPTTAESPAEADGPATDSGANASSPVPTDASDTPAAGGPTAGVPPSADSDKTSSAGMVVARTALGLVAMGLVLIGAL